MQSLRRHTAIRRIVGVALLAMLLAQWQVLAHAIAHGPWYSHAAALADIGRADQPGHAEDGWGHPAGAPACELFDALLGAQAPGAEPATAPQLPKSPRRFASPAQLADIGPALRAYEARGPPRA